LKEKRAVVKPILEGARRRFQVAAAEVAYQDKWQRAGLGFAVVGGDAGHLEQVLAQQAPVQVGAQTQTNRAPRKTTWWTPTSRKSRTSKFHLAAQAAMFAEPMVA